MPRAAARFDITATDKTKQAFATVNSKLGKLKGNALAVGSAFGIMGGLGTAAMAAATRNAINFGSAITDSAAATRTGVEELQALQFAAQEAGASSEQMEKLLIRSQKSAEDAANGLSTAARAFSVLGIEVETFRRLTPERQLELIGRKMNTAEDQAAAYGAALDILGTRNAPKLMEALQRLGTDGFDALNDRARAAGQVMDAELAQRLDSAADKIEAFKRKATIGIGEGLGYAMDTDSGGLLDDLSRFVTGRSIEDRVRGSAIGGVELPAHLQARAAELELSRVSAQYQGAFVGPPEPPGPDPAETAAVAMKQAGDRIAQSLNPALTEKHYARTEALQEEMIDAILSIDPTKGASFQ